MSEAFARDALLFAGEMFLLSAVILALAWEAAHAIRNRAALRHLIWAGGFFALIALPMLAWIVPSQFHFTVPSAPAVSEHVMTSFAANVDVAPVAAAPVAQAPAHFTMPDIHVDLAAVATVLFAMWLVGVIALALRGAAAAIGLRALKRSSRPHSFADGELIVGPRYEIRLSREPNGYGPITWGLFRPVILLPFNAMFWPRERLQAVLLHETAHIARRDSISQMLSMIACALYWPNPLVWMASRALRNEAEIAADDAVIASGMRPSSYAGELLQLASEFRSREPALAGMPLFMAGPSALEARVKSVLAATPYRSGVTAKDVLRISSIALLATTAMTFARPSFAQEETATPPSAPAVTSAPLPPPVADDMPAPPAPPTPSTPTVAPVPSAPPAVTVLRSANGKSYFGMRESDHIVNGHKIHHVWMEIDTRGMSDAELARWCPEIEHAKAQARAAEAQARTIAAQAQAQVRVANARAREQARVANAQAREAERQAREIQARMPQIQAQVKAEMAKIQPAIERAIAQARFERDMNLHIQMNDRENGVSDDESHDGPDTK